MRTALLSASLALVIGCLAPPASAAEGGPETASPPGLREAALEVGSGLAREVVQGVLRQGFGRHRACYEKGLAKDPTLRGSVTLEFSIGADGSVEAFQLKGSELPDAEMRECIAKVVRVVRFPNPEAPPVKVAYTIAFSPPAAPSAGEGGAPASASFEQPSADPGKGSGCGACGVALGEGDSWGRWIAAMGALGLTLRRRLRRRS